MERKRIKDIYAGMPDARDEINTGMADQFFKNFIIPPELPIDNLLNGRKFIISGYKGVGKTSILYYLQHLAQTNDPLTCTSFLYFKSDIEEMKKSSMDLVAKKLTALVDINGEIQPNKVDYLHLWRWVFFRKIVDDNAENENGLFQTDSNWEKFVELVNKISFNSEDKKVISLSTLSISLQISQDAGASAGLTATFDRVSKNDQAFQKLVAVVDQCEELFKKLVRTDIPYYIFVDEMEAYCGSKDLFIRDLTLIRDIIFTIHRLNSYGKIHIIAAVRNEIMYAMDRFIPTNEINKITDGFSVPIKWSYSNTNSYEHPIIKVLMKRISVAANGEEQSFADWFPKQVNNRDTVSYILDSGWNKPRDIVRFLIAAQNDTLHCNNTEFSQASFDALRKEYSKTSLSEIRQELQSLYTSEEIEMVIRLLRGGPRITSAEQIRRNAQKGSKARAFWDERQDDILEDFYRVGLWGNVNRNGDQYSWRWNHKGDTGVLIGNGWELAVHNALCSELSLFY